MKALDSAIEAIKALPESKKTNSHVGKIMAIQGDYAAIVAKEEYTSRAPGKRKKDIIEA